MWAALASILVGLGTAGYNAYQKKKLKKEMDAMGEEQYQIPQEYYDNLGLAQSEAQTGFSPETLAAITQQFQQGLASSNNAILQGGGGINDYAKMYGQYTNQIANLGVQDDMLRNQKIQNLLQATSTIAGQKALKWKVNEYDRERNNRAAAAMLMGGYQKGIQSGLGTAASGAAGLGNYYDSNSLQKEMAKLQKDNLQQETGNAPLVDESLFVTPQYANMEESENAIDISGMANLGGYNNPNQYNNFFNP